MLGCVWNATHLITYKNGHMVSVTALSQPPTYLPNILLFMNTGSNSAGNPTYWGNVIIDEVFLANRTMSDTEIAMLWEQGKDIHFVNGTTTSFAPAIATNFTVYAFDNQTGVAWNSFNATVNGTRYSTTTGNITLPVFTGGFVSLNVSAPPYYFDNFYDSWNVSINYNASIVRHWVIKAVDYNYNTSLTMWNATIDAFTPSQIQYNLTSQSEVITSLAGNDTSTHLLWIYAENYTSGGLSFWDNAANTTSNRSNYTMRMWQVEAYMNAKEKISQNPISDGSYLTSWGNNTVQKIPAGVELTTFVKSGYYNNSMPLVYSAGENTTVVMLGTYNRIMNITVYNINFSNILYYNLSIVSNDYPTWGGETFESSGAGTGSFEVINGSYNVTVSSGGYWTQTYTTNATNLTAFLYPYRINLLVKDAVSLASIASYNSTISLISGTAQNYTTTTYNTTIFSDLGIKTLNVTKIGYQTKSISLNLSSYGELNLTMNLSPYITFTLYNESTGGLFNPNTTSGVTLRIFCNSTTLEWTVTDLIGLTPIGCSWTKMRLYVTYGNTTYFRTLMPSTTVTNVSWYLIDLTSKIAVQKIFYLNDLSQQSNLGRFRVEKIIGTQQVTINEENWDIERKDIVYFILYDPYILTITDNAQVTRSLGYFYADTQSTHTITVPTIAFSPDQQVDDFQFGYLFTKPSISVGGSLYMQYQSTTGTLYSVNWLVVNGTNTSQVFVNQTFTTINGSSNFTGVVNGTTYLSQLTFNHSTYSTHTDTKIWNDLQGLLNVVFEGMRDPVGFKTWFAFIIITMTLLIFSAVSMSAGAVTTAVMTAIFYNIGWIPIGQWTFGILMLLAVLVAIIGEGIR